MLYKTQFDSPLGLLHLAAKEHALVGLWVEKQKHQGDLSKLRKKDDLDVFINVKKWLDLYFARKNPSLNSIPLAPAGTDFRQKVWAQLLKIPYGSFTSYGEIARLLGVNSAQAVGSAVGHNPISILIPCHRVLGAQGQLTEYASGLENKKKLLLLEGVIEHADLFSKV